MSAVKLVGVKIWFAHPKALEMRMRKLVLGLSVAQILPEKINKMFLTKKLGLIDVLLTVILPWSSTLFGWQFCFGKIKSDPIRFPFSQVPDRKASVSRCFPSSFDTFFELTETNVSINSLGMINIFQQWIKAFLLWISFFFILAHVFFLFVFLVNACKHILFPCKHILFSCKHILFPCASADLSVSGVTRLAFFDHVLFLIFTKFVQIWRFSSK